jgi:hypothetical protein
LGKGRRRKTSYQPGASNCENNTVGHAGQEGLIGCII